MIFFFFSFLGFERERGWNTDGRRLEERLDAQRERVSDINEGIFYIYYFNELRVKIKN